MPYRSIVPSINVNTESGQLRTELLNTFTRLDGQLILAPYRQATFNGPVLTSGAAETDLLTTNIDTGILSKQGSSLLIFACGTTAANANNKTIKLYFGSTEIFTTGAFAGNDIDWTLQAEIVRNGASAQITWAQFFGSATLTSKIQVGTASVNLAVKQDITLTGTGTTTGDVSALYWKITLLT
jgi:hypothetical protein